MKKILVSLVLLVGTLLSAKGYSLDCFNHNCDMYAGLIGGPNWLDVNPIHNVKFNSKTGYLVGGVVGCRVDNTYRLETEISFRRNSFYLPNCFPEGQKIQGHANTWAFMANGYYDLNCHPTIRPYVGFGLGYAKVRDYVRFSDFQQPGHNTQKFNQDGFAYQVMVGVNYMILEDTDVGVEYRYFSISNSKMDNNSLALTVKRYF